MQHLLLMRHFFHILLLSILTSTISSSSPSSSSPTINNHEYSRFDALVEYALAQDSDYLNLGLADERGDITQRMNTDKNDTDSIEEQSGQVQLEGSMTDPRISNDLSSFKPKRRIKVPKKLIGVDVKEEDEEGKKKREVGDTVEPITKKERTRKPREKKERTRKPKEKKERTRKPREKKQKEMKDIERKPREKKQREKDMERKEMEMKLSEY